jgi:hypothetical protein
VFEKECFDVPLTEIQTEYDEVFPKVVDVNWVYDEGTKTLKFSLKKDQINAFVKIFSTEKTLYSEGVSTSNIFEKSIVLPKENLYLSVDDLDAKQQQLFTLNLAVPIEKQSAVEVAENPVTKEQTELATCKGSVCSTGFTCTIDTFNSKDGACCSGECIQQVQTGEEGTAPLILWIALIIVTIAAIVVFNSINKVKRK